jgi:hypothetical protein
MAIKKVKRRRRVIFADEKKADEDNSQTVEEGEEQPDPDQDFKEGTGEEDDSEDKPEGGSDNGGDKSPVEVDDSDDESSASEVIGDEPSIAKLPITKVTIYRSTKLNITNYESVDANIGIHLELQPGDDLEAVYMEGLKWVERKLKQALGRGVAQRKSWKKGKG